MKLQFPKLALALVALTGLAAATARAEDTKSTFKVNGMMCTSCEGKVKGAVTKVDGVKSVEADSEKGTAVVSYDPTKTSEAKITEAINNTSFKVAK